MESDPWEWSVDEVVQAFCHDRSLWPDDGSRERLPQPLELERRLREHDIDGKALLGHVDIRILGEMGLLNVRERLNIRDGISKLKRKSSLYAAWRRSSDLARTPSPGKSQDAASHLVLAAANLGRPNVSRQALAPSELQSASDASRPISGHAEGIEASNAKRKRRRVQLEQPSSTTQGDTFPAHSTDAYLCRQKSSVESTLYGNPRGRIPPGDELETEENFHFIRAPRSIAAGHRCVVQRRIQRMFRTPLLSLGPSQLVKYHYPRWPAQEGDTKHATLYTMVDGKVLVQRKHALFLDANIDDFTGDDSWDFLSHKLASNKHDDVLPLYDESGSENDFDDDLLDEIEAEARTSAQDSSLRHLLSREQVLEVINRNIDNYVTKWADDGLARREAKAGKIWSKRSRGTIAASRAALVDCEKRLAVLRKNIAEDHWFSESKLDQQCRSLRPTVNEIQTEIWKRKLWSGSRPAQASPEPTRPRARPKKHLDASPNSSGEELETDSESDIIVSDDQISDGDPSASPDNLATNRQSTAERHPPKGVNSLSNPEDNSERLLSDTEDDYEPPDISGFGQDANGEESEDSVFGTVTKRPKAQGFEPGEVIDLTAASPEGLSPSPLSETGPLSYEVAPEIASDAEIARWSWEKLDEERDCRRIVMKLLHEMPNLQRKGVEELFLNHDGIWLRDFVKKAIASIQKSRDVVSGLQSEATVQSLFLASRLWVCWYHARHTLYHISANEDNALEDARAISDEDDFGQFFSFLRRVIRQPDDLSDASDADRATPRKKRKNIIRTNRTAQTMRTAAQQRRNEADEQEQLILGSQNGNLVDAADQVIINVSKSETDDYIFLNPHIARSVKPHQQTGIRFMWREIISSDQGCLLAHTMGLGKTMQTISLLLTIAEAAQSPIENISRQIAERLRRRRTLVLCPPVLIPNWQNEFQKWLPSDSWNVLGQIYALTASVDQASRIDIIDQWYNSSGILVMSYQIFQKFVIPTTPAVPTQDEATRRQLLHGPTIVVADEAHKLKNPASKISQAVRQLEATARIALTGSPLANNLRDYYAMIHWIAPGYLGDLLEFRANFQEPIEAGLYADSTQHEVRRSLKRLRWLKEEIAPKINRADITALQADLRPKTEFVIKITLADVQEQLYASFIELVCGSGAVDNARIFSVLHFLRTLCNHPSIFLRCIKEAAGKFPKRVVDLHERPDDHESRETDSADVDEQALPQDLSELMQAEQSKIVERIGIGDRILDPFLSNKMAILVQILLLAKAQGDQTLVFSHSIPTLDYIETTLSNLKVVTWTRLDGKTKMSSRMDKIQEFRESSADAFLISTAAGALGLNITSANRVILVDFHYSASYEEQAVGRAYRIGQKKDVFVYHLVTVGTYESKLHDVTIFKRQVAFRVVDHKAPTRYASKASEYLFAPYKVDKQPLDPFRGKDKIMDQLLDSPLSNHLQSLHTTETMHAEKEEVLTEEEVREVDEMMNAEKSRRALAAPGEHNQHRVATAGRSMHTQPSSQLAGREHRMHSNIPPSSLRTFASQIGGALWNRQDAAVASLNQQSSISEQGERGNGFSRLGKPAGHTMPGRSIMSAAGVPGWIPEPSNGTVHAQSHLQNPSTPPRLGWMRVEASEIASAPPSAGRQRDNLARSPGSAPGRPVPTSIDMGFPAREVNQGGKRPAPQSWLNH